MQHNETQEDLGGRTIAETSAYKSKVWQVLQKEALRGWQLMNEAINLMLQLSYLNIF